MRNIIVKNQKQYKSALRNLMSMKKSKVSSCSIDSHFWVQIKIHVLMLSHLKTWLGKSEKGSMLRRIKKKG